MDIGSNISARKTTATVEADSERVKSTTVRREIATPQLTKSADEMQKKPDSTIVSTESSLLSAEQPTQTTAEKVNPTFKSSR